ncbi:CotH kinase family protein [Chondromyces crocatus]|uniref:Spore coat protein H n=1 Tax=Chondromyces crocatus TaxID=52 RepID=A0A0K1EJT9_CHOCO|nr:CotH kinase family protein [Chondromyces crocatus]AKT41126.1 spore coat protein H [Chondromyces crocatus]
MRPDRVLSLMCGAAVASGCVVPEDEAAQVFDRSVLHTVEIYVGKQHLDQLATDLDERVPCTLIYDGNYVPGAGVRQKGNDLVDLADKPSFSVKFDEFADTKLHGLNKILLNASIQDPTFLRELIGADMYTRAGLPTARTAHAQVRFNGEDRGIYVVVESVDKDFLRVHFGEQNEEGNLYEGPCCGDFIGDVEQLELKDEDEGRTRDDIRGLAQIIAQTPDALLENLLTRYLDLDGFMKGYALDAALAHWDGYAYRANNYYLYNNPDDDRFVFIPHGMDRILDDASFDTETTPVALLPQRIRAIPTLEAQFQSALASVMITTWNETAMTSAMDRTGALLRAASAGPRTTQDLATFEASVGPLKEALTRRRALLDPGIACGDGQQEGLETCDDGNTASGDGCGKRCRVEP